MIIFCSPKQVASLGTSQDSLRLIRRGQSAMKAPQYQIVSVVGKIVTEEEYQVSHLMRLKVLINGQKEFKYCFEKFTNTDK